jgi:hypothetical protein
VFRPSIDTNYAIAPIELYLIIKLGQTSYIIYNIVIIRVRNNVRINIGVTSGAPAFIIIIIKVVTIMLVLLINVDIKVATLNIMLIGRVLAPTANIKRIVEVAVFIKVINGSLTIETRV